MKIFGLFHFEITPLGDFFKEVFSKDLVSGKFYLKYQNSVSLMLTACRDMPLGRSRIV